jgi:hypothetical protein
MNDKVIAGITQNVWKFKPSGGGWDMNYNSDTFEVKDGAGDIVLQVQTQPDRVQFQGIWWTSHPQLFPEKVRIAIYEKREYRLKRFEPEYTGSSVMIQKLRAGEQIVQLPRHF